MKSWFARFRISNALDTGNPLPPRLRRRLERDPELRAFAEAAARLERGLSQPAQPELPPFAHNAIMRAVEAAQPEAQPNILVRVEWLPVAGFAVLLLLGVWWLGRPALRPVPQAASLESATTALVTGQQMAQDLPATVVAPLTDEWRRLGLDWDNTAQFLLSSLP
jgi:hypothetical protein